MERTRKEQSIRGTEPPTGLGAWLVRWIQTPLRVKFSGMGKGRAKRRMELVEMLPLGGKRQLMLVVCDGQRFLVGAGGDSIHSIAEMRSPLASGFAPDAMVGGLAGDGLIAAMQSSEREM